MTDAINEKLPWTFWSVTVAALLWNALGVFAFITQPAFNPDAMQYLSAEQRALVEGTPIWALVAYGVAVFGGLTGALALLLKRKIAALLFGASLLGVIVQFTHAFFLASTKVSLEAAQVVLPALVMIIAVFLYLFARKQISKAVLK